MDNLDQIHCNIWSSIVIWIMILLFGIMAISSLISLIKMDNRKDRDDYLEDKDDDHLFPNGLT